MSTTEETIAVVNTIRTKLDEANVSLGIAVNVISKVAQETSALLAELAGLRAAVNLGNTTPASLDTLIADVLTRAQNLATIAQSVSLDLVTVDNLVPDVAPVVDPGTGQPPII